MQRRQIETHTALRGVAALSVVAYHLQFGGGYHLGVETATDLWRRSYLFVDLFFILSGFIIALVASTWTDRGLLPQLAVNRVTRFLGEISYSVYLTHAVILSVFNWRRIDPIAALDPPLVRAAYLVLAFALVILVSWLSYNRIEKPARRWLSRRITGHGPAPIVAVAPAP